MQRKSTHSHARRALRLRRGWNCQFNLPDVNGMSQWTIFLFWSSLTANLLAGLLALMGRVRL